MKTVMKNCLLVKRSDFFLFILVALYGFNPAESYSMDQLPDYVY